MWTQRPQFRIGLYQLVEITPQFPQSTLLHAFFQLFNVRLLIHFPALGVIIATAGNWAFTIRNAIAARNRSRQWSPEVLRNLNQLFWAGDGDQPHHQKKAIIAVIKSA